MKVEVGKGLGPSGAGEVGSRGKRGEVTGFSRGSRRRLLDVVNSINQDEVPVHRVHFVTLTYPGSGWPRDCEVWKGQLEALRKRIERRFGKFPVLWRLEFKERRSGAAEGLIGPHFHLLLFVPPALTSGVALKEARAWISRAWYEVVGSGEPDHLKAGTQWKPVESWRGVSGYAAKYLGKEAAAAYVDTATGEVLRTGRVWGAWNRELLPIELKVRGLTRRQLHLFRRPLFRLLGWKRRGVVRGGSFYVNAAAAARLVEWATSAG